MIDAKTTIVQFVSIVTLLLPTLVQAAGISLDTDKLTIATWDFLPARTTFNVSNPNPVHSAIKLAAEGDGQAWIKLSERQLVLAPNESRAISIRVSSRRGGDFRPVISIQQQPLEGAEPGIATGIKLPVAIHSRALTGPLLAATLIFLIAAIIKFLKKT